jgi:catechol 2,3-dioxygenase-like lactoylglutathione lyase family enzyme
MKLTMGVHVLLYSSDADADRAFLAKVLDLKSVDVGGGWLIFGLPPAEMAVHPTDAGAPAASGPGMIGAHVYLMCDDVQATIAALAKKGVECGPVHTERWGLRTAIPLPSGSALGLYQPTHPTALGMV